MYYCNTYTYELCVGFATVSIDGKQGAAAMRRFVMKRFMMTLLLAVAYVSGAEGQTCMLPADTQAFNIIALKSALMVGALSCNQGEQ